MFTDSGFLQAISWPRSRNHKEKKIARKIKIINIFLLIRDILLRIHDVRDVQKKTKKYSSIPLSHTIVPILFIL